MKNKELEIAYFLSFCIEQYKHKHQMSGDETVSLFDKYDICSTWKIFWSTSYTRISMANRRNRRTDKWGKKRD